MRKGIHSSDQFEQPHTTAHRRGEFRRIVLLVQFSNSVGFFFFAETIRLHRSELWSIIRPGN